MNEAQQAPAPAPVTAAVSVVQPMPQPWTGPYIGAWAGAVLALAGILTLIYKLATRDLVRDIADNRHKIGNVVGRVDALEHLRTSDIERIVRVEASIVSVREGLERIDKNLSANFGQLAESIREIRNVAPRRG